MPHVERTQHETISADVRAAVEAMRRGARSRRSCLHHGLLLRRARRLRQAGGGHGLDGVIGFYGSPTGPCWEALPPRSWRVADFTCPVLGLFGDDDPGIPAESITAFGAALAAAGVANRPGHLPRRPTSFFDRTAAEHADAAQDACARCSTSSGSRSPTDAARSRLGRPSAPPVGWWPRPASPAAGRAAARSRCSRAR